MATSNVSFEFAANLAAVAATGGEAIHGLAAGRSMEMITLPIEELCADMKQHWFDEDWPAVIKSPFCECLGKHAFEGDLPTYHNDMARLLSACCMPRKGLTLFKAKSNFHTEQFTPDPKVKLEMFSSFGTGDICIANTDPLPQRVQWQGMDEPIRHDKVCIVNGVKWHCHEVNFGQFFSVTEHGLLFEER